MKKMLFALAAVAVLSGCAVAPAGPVYYSARAPQAYDPYQWHTVSSEPVQTQSVSRVEYSSEPVYESRTVYVPQPVYVQQPVYAAPSYYYPPVTIGLDFVFGNRCCGWGGRGRYGYGHHGRR